MTLSILLTAPWDSKAEDAPSRLEVPKVHPHRFAWKNAGAVGIPKDPWNVVPQRWVEGDEAGTSEEAEVVTSASDEAIFQTLHGVIAKDANYGALAERIPEADYAGMVETLQEMGSQHPAAMWFVKSWIVETGAYD